MIKAIFFDLDYTLYDQSLYFSSGFSVISRYLSEQFSLVEKDVVANLWRLLNAKGSMYPKLYNDLLDTFGIYDEALIKYLVHLFHIAPVESLILYEDTLQVLPILTQRYLLGLITNGHSTMQQRKVAALDLATWLTIFVYTDEFGCPKPGMVGYEQALNRAKLGGQDCLYVGDNPYVDFTGAKQVGMHTVRILRGEFIEVKGYDEVVDAQVKDFYELEKLLLQL